MEKILWIKEIVYLFVVPMVVCIISQKKKNLKITYVVIIIKRVLNLPKYQLLVHFEF